MSIESDGMKIASWNMQAVTGTRRYLDYALRFHDGVLPGRKKKSLRIQEAGARLGGFDVLALQECDPGSFRTGFVHQGQALALAAGFEHDAYHVARRMGPMASSALGILSRHPLRNVQGHVLPSRLPGRGALEAMVDHPLGAFRLLVVHLSLGRRDQVRQLAWVHGWVKQQDDLPSVVVGDFNAAPGSLHFDHLIESLGETSVGHTSFPSWKPNRALDHIVVAGCSGDTVTACDFGGSDHLAVSRQIWFKKNAVGACNRHREHGHGPSEG